MSIKPPGSTFKPLAAIAALDLGVIDTNTTFYCPGYFTFGRVFKCDGVHGSLNVFHAIEKSCNVFFYNLIFKIELDRWADYARRFGFTQETGIDIREKLPVSSLTVNIMKKSTGRMAKKYYGKSGNRAGGS